MDRAAIEKDGQGRVNAQLDLLPEQRIPPRGSQCYELLMAMLNGARLTVKVALEQHHVYALSQRVGDLRRKYGWPVRSQIIEIGPRTHVAEYWIETRGQN